MRQGQLRAVLGYLHRAAHSDSGGPDDAQLLERWRTQRDPAAFEVLVWRHGATVWNVCRRILIRDQDVEDAFQATFLTFLRKADTVGQSQFLGSWLYKVAYRIALAARATAIKHTVSQQMDADLPEPAVNEEDDWAELGPVLDEEVNLLPEKYRLPFVLCYLEGKTTDEAAHDLGCPRGTVGTRLAWARERLRSRLTRRGVVLSSAGLAALLSEKAAASVPPPLVMSTVHAATFSTVENALTSGVISERAAALTQEALRTLFVSKLKTVGLILLTVGLLGGGTGLLTHHALAGKIERTPTVGRKPSIEDVLPNRNPVPALAEDDVTPSEEVRPQAAPEMGVKDADPLRITGTVSRVDDGGRGFAVEFPVGKGEVRRVEVQLADRSQLVFSNVGPNEARLTTGYAADVWFEKNIPGQAARVQLSGKRVAASSVLNEKTTPPHRVGRVVDVTDDGAKITLEKAWKGEQPRETVAIRLTEQTRTFYSNVSPGEGGIRLGYEARVWLEDNSTDAARAVSFFGNADQKPAQGKGPKADRIGRIVRVSDDAKILTVESFPVKGERTTIRLTEDTTTSYHGIAAEGARPTEGYQVQVWLAEGSPDTAARVRFSRNTLRKGLEGKVVSVSADGTRFTLESPSKVKSDPIRREITITPQTDLVFFNVRPEGARLTEGDPVRCWLVDGPGETADEVVVLRPE